MIRFDNRTGRHTDQSARDRLSETRLAELLAAPRAAGVMVRDDGAARTRFAELRALYEPVGVGPGVLATDGTSGVAGGAEAGQLAADPLHALGVLATDHFE